MCRQCIFDLNKCPCEWKCNCDYSCLLCQHRWKTSCGDWHSAAFYLEDVRDKYLCIDCRLVWKTKHTKYFEDTIDYHKWYNEKLLEHYYNKTEWGKPSCKKCGKPGVKVGRNFRPCKNDKQWRQLLKDVEDGKTDLIKDFYHYPRETVKKPSLIQ